MRTSVRQDPWQRPSDNLPVVPNRRDKTIGKGDNSSLLVVTVRSTPSAQALGGGGRLGLPACHIWVWYIHFRWLRKLPGGCFGLSHVTKGSGGRKTKGVAEGSKRWSLQECGGCHSDFTVRKGNNSGSLANMTDSKSQSTNEGKRRATDLRHVDRRRRGAAQWADPCGPQRTHGGGTNTRGKWGERRD